MKAAPEMTLVLGGGGVTGIAWQLGLLAGLADAGIDLRARGPVLGTSAGSTVGAQLTSGLSLDELYARQLDGVPYEIPKSLSGVPLAQFLLAQLRPGSVINAARRVGRLAEKARTGSIPERRGVIAARLPNHDWPESSLGLVVTDTESGEGRIITWEDGFALIDAVAASCAVPMVWPCVTLGDRLYMDGGIRSTLNLDLAPGSGPVVALAPMTLAFKKANAIAAQRHALGADRPVMVITPDVATKRAQGRNPLDSSVVPAVARAARAQAAQEAPALAALLG